MPIAVNGQGDAVYLTEDGQWAPAKIAENPQTKERLAFDGKEWKPLPAAAPAAAAPAKADAVGSGAGADAAMQVLKGVPVLGAWAENAGAAVSAAAQPMTGVGAPGESWRDRYDANVKTEKDASAKFEKDNPWTSTGLQLGGGVASMTPLMAIPRVAALLGAGAGQTMAARIPLGAVSGGGISVADALARDHNPTIAGGIGTVVGGVAPVAGKAAGAVAGRVVDALAGVTGELQGTSRGARTLLRGAGTPEAQAKYAELGPDAMLMEGTPSTFSVAQGLATRPGEGLDHVVGAVTAREKGNVGRLRTDTDAALGPYQEPGALKARIDEEIAQASKGYAAAAGAGQQRLDVKPIIQQLDEAIATEAGPAQKALKEARSFFYGPVRDKMPDGTPVYGKTVTVAPDGTVKVEAAADKLKSEVYELHRVRMALDDLFDQLGETPRAQGLITKLRQDLDGLMPAPMKAVDRIVEDLSKQKEALKIGQGEILRTGPEAMTPAGLARLEISGGHAGGPISPGQADMLKAGVRADVERMTGTQANDVQALRKAVGGEGDWNRKKLEQIFGPSEADSILKSVDREVAFQQAYNKLVNNSQTAQRTGGREAIEAVAPEGKTIPPIWDRLGQIPEAITKPGWNSIVQEFQGARRGSLDAELGPLLTKTGGDRDRVVQALADWAARNDSFSVPADRIAQSLALNEGVALPHQTKRQAAPAR